MVLLQWLNAPEYTYWTQRLETVFFPQMAGRSSTFKSKHNCQPSIAYSKLTRPSTEWTGPGACLEAGSQGPQLLWACSEQEPAKSSLPSLCSVSCFCSDVNSPTNLFLTEKRLIADAWQGLFWGNWDPGGMLQSVLGWIFQIFHQTSAHVFRPGPDLRTAQPGRYSM